MDQAELSLAHSLHALVNQQNALANNLANVSSNGFKRQSGTFEPFQTSLERAGKTLDWQPSYREYTDFTQGDLQFTGDPLQLALQGDGFLKVRVPGDSTQSFLTRQGNLVVDANGTLVTSEGLEVLDPGNQPIRVGEATGFLIDANGSIDSKEDGSNLGRIGRFRVDDRDKLQPLGGGLFRSTESSGAPTADAFTRINQGNVERSNVNSISEMVAMITVQRHFQSVTRAMSAIESATDQLNQAAMG